MTDPYTSLTMFIVRQRMEHYAQKRAEAQLEEQREPASLPKDEEAPAQDEALDPPQSEGPASS